MHVHTFTEMEEDEPLLCLHECLWHVENVIHSLDFPYRLLFMQEL